MSRDEKLPRAITDKRALWNDKNITSAFISRKIGKYTVRFDRVHSSDQLLLIWLPNYIFAESDYCCMVDNLVYYIARCTIIILILIFPVELSF